ncbi:histone H1-like [Colletes gigas]|uniref:histone H1-like n=1 Tax=Colletes gigas TaxID=935657 RepID=UPI001C9AD281|nr:histone H1-like [Colletes gigas]
MEDKNSSGTVAVAESAAMNTSLKKVTKSKPKASRIKSSHPPTSEMVNSAIKELKDRKGSSLQAIKKYIASTYKVDGEKLAPFIKRYLKTAVTSGAVVQTKGKGASGSFKLSLSPKGSDSKGKPKRELRKTESSVPEKKVAEKKPASQKRVAAVKKPAAIKKPVAVKKPVAASPKKMKTAAAKKAQAMEKQKAAQSKNLSKTKKATKAPAAKTRTPKPKTAKSPKATKSSKATKATPKK